MIKDCSLDIACLIKTVRVCCSFWLSFLITISKTISSTYLLAFCQWFPSVYIKKSYYSHHHACSVNTTVWFFSVSLISSLWWHFSVFWECTYQPLTQINLGIFPVSISFASQFLAFLYSFSLSNVFQNIYPSTYNYITIIEGILKYSSWSLF